LHKRNKEKIKGWNFNNEKIMTIDIKEENEEWTLLIVYALNEDDTEENKTQFYECLQRTYETIGREVFLLGDLNVRVGNNSERRNGVIGEQGEETLNNNGERLLNFCIMNDLIILSTMFIHKDIHNITREEPSRKEKSIIDYIIVQREMRTYIWDTRVKRGPEINSDH
jgi:exonuclease III